MPYPVLVRKIIFLLASAIVVTYPIALGRNWILEEWGGRAVSAFIVAIVALIVVETRDRADFKDQLRVITDGIEVVDSALEELVSANAKQCAAKFQELYKVSTNAITGLANPTQVQAQFFLTHDHEDHSHLVSIYSSGGNAKKSDNHFSSVGDPLDVEVWRYAKDQKTRFYRNLAWHRLSRMPPGFKRLGRKRYTTFITSPVICDDQVLGLLTINSTVPFSLSANDVRLVETIARKIGIGAARSASLQKPKEYDTIKSTRKKGCRV